MGRLLDSVSSGGRGLTSNCRAPRRSLISRRDPGGRILGGELWSANILVESKFASDPGKR